MAEMIIPRGIITKVYHAEKSDVDYLTIEEGNSTIKLKQKKSLVKPEQLLVPAKIKAVVVGSLYGNNLNLEAVSLEVTPV